MRFTTKSLLHGAILVSALLLTGASHAKEETPNLKNRNLRHRGNGQGGAGAGEDGGRPVSYLVSLAVDADLAPHVSVGQSSTIDVPLMDYLSIVEIHNGSTERQPISGRIAGSVAGVSTPGKVFVSYFVTTDPVEGVGQIGPFTVSGFVDPVSDSPQTVSVIGYGLPEAGQPTLQATEGYSIINALFMLA